MSRIRADKILDRAGTGSVELTEGATLPSGKTISGSGTIAVNSSGTSAGLTGTPSITVSDITGIGANLSGIATVATGARVTAGGLVVTAGISTFMGGLVEKYENAGTTLGSQTNNPLADGNVILFTGNESGTLTINFTGVHAALTSGQNVSFTVILTPNNSGYINAVQVDGQAITPQWSGGSAPSGGGSSGRDVYNFTILKTGSGTSDYVILGALTNFA